MATLQQAPAAEKISVENPATGAVVGLLRVEDLAAAVARR